MARAIEPPTRCTTQEALAYFDSLKPIQDAKFLLGGWKGFEVATGHPMDGILAAVGWYGKTMESEERVHPLVFVDEPSSPNKKVFVKPVYSLLYLAMYVPWLLRCKAIQPLLAWVMKVCLKTQCHQAKLMTKSSRNQNGIAMVYNQVPITDHFRVIDQRRVLGMMDMKGVDKPFFFCLERDDHHRMANQQDRPNVSQVEQGSSDCTATS